MEEWLLKVKAFFSPALEDASKTASLNISALLVLLKGSGISKYEGQ